MAIINAAFSQQDSPYKINTRGLFREYLTYSDIPVTYEPNNQDKDAKKRRLFGEDGYVNTWSDALVNDLKDVFCRRTNNKSRSSAHFKTLYEMLDVSCLGRYLEGLSPRGYCALDYDHGHKSSVALRLSNVSGYTDINFPALQRKIKSLEFADETTLNNTINQIGNMEFSIMMVEICENLNAVCDKEIERIKRTEKKNKQAGKITEIITKRNRAFKHISEITNSYLEQISIGNQKTFPCITPGSKNSFSKIARDLGSVAYLFGQKSKKNPGLVYDIDLAFAKIQPLMDCQNLNIYDPKKNPLCTIFNYTAQTNLVTSEYYAGNQSLTSDKVDRVLESKYDSGM